MIKSILGGKSKNLFDISKADVVIHSDTSFSSNVSYNSHFYSIPVEAGQTYTVSYDIYAIEGGGIQIGLTCQTGDFYQDGVLLFLQLTPDSSINNWKHITNTFTIPSGATKITFSSLKYPDYPKYFRNFQIELGSTATEYVPHELTSYKSIMKVSDVCQLVDKSKIPTTRTISGVTFTNNGDGSVTVNGTSTHQYYSEIVIPIDGSLFIPGHVYLNGTIAGDFAGFVALYGPVAKDYIMAPQYIYTLPSGKDFNKFRYIIRVRKGMTANNYKCTPQLFDLTEMFGAGNEPKTVAEFKAKFPNDYYPYSPSCFVTSFDERMPCKTKNLFNYKNSDSTAKTITSNGVTLSLKNDYFELYGTQQEDKYFECSLTQFNIPFTAGKTYILSLDNAIPKLDFVYFNGFYNDDTTKQLNLLRVQGTNNNPLKTFTPTKDGYFSQIVVYSPKKLRFSGNYNMRVQIEENSHKSEYVPHNYV